MPELDDRQGRLFAILNECYQANPRALPPPSLQEAAHVGDLELVKAFLQDGSPIDARGRMGSALDLAIGRGHAVVAQHLVSRGAALTDWPGLMRHLPHSPQHPAYSDKALAHVQYLVDTGAPPPVLLEAFWQVASHGGLQPCISTLLAAGVDPRATAPLRHESPLEAARRGGYPDAVRMMESGAAGVPPPRSSPLPRPPAQPSPSGPSEARRAALLAEARELAAEVDWHCVDFMGRPLLNTAARTGIAEVVATLLARGADVNERDARFGTTPVVEATMEGRTDVVELLVRAGADLRDEPGRRALFLAAGRADRRAVELLLGAGADVNAQDAGTGQTALMAAAGSGDLELVTALLAAGARPDDTDRKGKRATFYAVGLHKKEMRRRLKTKAA